METIGINISVSKIKGSADPSGQRRDGRLCVKVDTTLRLRNDVYQAVITGRMVLLRWHKPNTVLTRGLQMATVNAQRGNTGTSTDIISMGIDAYETYPPFASHGVVAQYNTTTKDIVFELEAGLLSPTDCQQAGTIDAPLVVPATQDNPPIPSDELEAKWERYISRINELYHDQGFIKYFDFKFTKDRRLVGLRRSIQEFDFD